MNFRDSVVRLAFGLALFAAVAIFGAFDTSAQAPSATEAATFRVGLKSIAVSAPTNELVETGSDYRVILDALTPATNRLVAAFLLPQDLKAIQNGSAALSRYAFVEVPRRAEFATITPDIFKEIAGSLGEEFGATLDAKLKDVQEDFNRRLKDLGASSTTVLFDKPLMLGAFFSKPDAVGFGSIMTIDANGKKKTMVMGMSVIRTQERVLFLYLYTPYVDDESVNWARTTSEKWSDAILAANK